MLVGARAPLDGSYQTRPNTLDEFCLRQRMLFLLRLNRDDDLGERKLVVNPPKRANLERKKKPTSGLESPLLK